MAPLFKPCPTTATDRQEPKKCTGKVCSAVVPKKDAAFPGSVFDGVTWTNLERSLWN